MSDLIIEARDLHKSYRLHQGKAAVLGPLLNLKGHADDPVFEALRGINLNIRKGERVGIVGRNGAGKTTLLKLLLGHVKPTSGSLTVRGSVHAMMKTDLGIHAHFTGRQNVLSSLAYNNIYGEEAQQKLEEIREFTELGAYLDQPFMNYSLGMQSRLLFAIATCVHPDILIVDEMLGAGDAYFSSKSTKRMQALIDRGCSLLLVSHNTQQIMQFCDKVIWLRAGQVYHEGPARDVINAYDVYIEKEIQKYKNGIPVSDATDQRNSVPKYDPENYQETLQDGKKVYRWGTPQGVGISSIDLYADGKPATHITGNQNVELRFTLDVLSTGAFNCRYLLTFWDKRGHRIARLENNVDSFDGVAGEKRSVRVSMNPLQLFNGEYTVSVSIYDMGRDASSAGGRDVRCDVLAHCIDFDVAETNLGALTPYVRLTGTLKEAS